MFSMTITTTKPDRQRRTDNGASNVTMTYWRVDHGVDHDIPAEERRRRAYAPPGLQATLETSRENNNVVRPEGVRDRQLGFRSRRQPLSVR